MIDELKSYSEYCSHDPGRGDDRAAGQVIRITITKYLLYDLQYAVKRSGYFQIY
jgi:hypothetical protein